MIKVMLNDVDVFVRDRIVLEEFSIGVPEPKLIKVTIPGRDGDLDMSEALTGYVNYSNREIVLQFGIIGREEEIEIKKLSLFNLVLGKLVKVNFSHLSGYFTGRCTLKSQSRENRHHTITLVVDASPYRLDTQETIVQTTLTASNKTLTCVNKMMPVFPVIETSATATVVYNNKTFTLQKGVHHLGIVLHLGSHNFTVKGSGTIKIKYRSGVI